MLPSARKITSEAFPRGGFETGYLSLNQILESMLKINLFFNPHWNAHAECTASWGKNTERKRDHHFGETFFLEMTEETGIRNTMLKNHK